MFLVCIGWGGVVGFWPLEEMVLSKKNFLKTKITNCFYFVSISMASYVFYGNRQLHRYLYENRKLG